MKILNLMQCSNLGGMEQASLCWMREAKRMGHSCRVLSLNPLGLLAPSLQAAGIPADGVPYRGRWGWRSLSVVRRKLRHFQPDALVMTGHNLMGMLALDGVCVGHRVLAIHFHHTGVKPRWQWRLIYELAWRRFRAITFPSDFVRREAESICPSIASIAHTVRIPTPLPPYPTPQARRAAREALKLPHDAPVIGNAGWLIPRKRFDLFLRVAERVAARVADAVFVIAGDGPERAKMEWLTAVLGIRDRVRWLSWQKDLSTFYQSLDVLLFNSDWDAMGRTPLEALSYGVPVVASVQHGGLCEVMDDDKYGFLFTSHDLDGMAQRVIWLVRDKASAQEIGRAGRAHVGCVGDVEHCTEALLRLLGASPRAHEIPVLDTA